MDGAQARLKHMLSTLDSRVFNVERVDGAQARLKHNVWGCIPASTSGGKGGWGSGEIEIFHDHLSLGKISDVERVDGAQARLKYMAEFAGAVAPVVVERVDGAQARLKSFKVADTADICQRGKGGWGSGEIEMGRSPDSTRHPDEVERVDGAQARLKSRGSWDYAALHWWKGWMGLRRD